MVGEGGVQWHPGRRHPIAEISSLSAQVQSRRSVSNGPALPLGTDGGCGSRRDKAKGIRMQVRRTETSEFCKAFSKEGAMRTHTSETSYRAVTLGEGPAREVRETQPSVLLGKLCSDGGFQPQGYKSIIWKALKNSNAV